MSFKVEYTIHFGTLKKYTNGNNNNEILQIKYDDVDFKDQNGKKFTFSVFDYFNSQTIRSLKENFLSYFGKNYKCCLCVLYVYKYKSSTLYLLSRDETKKLSSFNIKDFYIVRINNVCDCQLKIYNFYYNKDKFDLIVDLKKLNDDVEKLKKDIENLNKDKEALNNSNKNLLEKIKKITKEKELEPKDATKFYDSIICIDSIKSVKKGWKIKMNRRGLSLYENCRKEKLLRIGVIGNKNKGKSFLLSKISKTKLISGTNIHTEGLSIKYPDRKIMKDKNIILLDSAGFESPVLKNNDDEQEVEDEKMKKEKEDKKNEDENENKIEENNKEENNKDNEEENEESQEDEDGIKEAKKEMENKLREKRENMQFKESAKDKIMTEVFLQNFIINNSDILLLVVGIMSYSEQLLINKIKNECKELKKEKLFIVHNLQSFRKVEQVENYIKKTLLKCKTFNLKRHKIISLANEYVNDEIEEEDDKKEEEEEYNDEDIENIKDDDDSVNNENLEKKEIKIEEKKNDKEKNEMIINNKDEEKKNEKEKKDMNEEDAKEGEPSHFYEVLYYDKDKTLNIYHLILANDESEECKKYNKYTYNFLENMYNFITNIESFDIFKEIKKAFFEISPIILINDVKDIHFNKTKDILKNKLLKLEVKDDKDIELKQCFTDELGFSFFKTGFYEPKYNYFKPDENTLEIRLEIPGAAKCSVKAYVENGLTKIQFKGTKKYDKNPENPADNKCCTREFTDFELVLPLPIEEYKINSEKPKEKPILEQGLYIVRYELAKQGEEVEIENEGI